MPPKLATWLLNQFTADQALIGDLVQRHHAGRSIGWFWRQVLIATFVNARKHALVMVGAFVLAWMALVAFFGIVTLLLPVLERYLLTTGLVEPYSVGWRVRNVMLWIVVGFPFLGTGWLVARIAWRTPILPVVAFAVSVSATTSIPSAVYPWHLAFLIVPVAILIGGLLGTRLHRSSTLVAS